MARDTDTDTDADDAASAEDPDEDERWLVIDGRRWRRTDPSLPDEVVTSLQSHLGRARAAVRAGKRAEDDAAIGKARERVGLAKHGLGERGPYWWDESEDARLERAQDALTRLDELAPPSPS